MDRNVMLERLQWLATAERGAQADWLPDNDWHRGIAEVATAALDEIKFSRTIDARTWADPSSLYPTIPLRLIADWRPIEMAPLLGPNEAHDGYVFNCLLQSSTGIVGEGVARYVKDGRIRGNKHVRVLRWYFGDGARDCRVCKDPKYFMPLPAKRED